jgi:adenylate kinase family enzyme
VIFELYDQVGKGTYAKMIKQDFGYNHISTGDEIRKILKGQTSEDFDKTLINKIKDIVNSGIYSLSNFKVDLLMTTSL